MLKLPIVPPERKGKRLGVFLATAGQNWSHVFDAAVPSVKCFFHVIDIKDADISYLMINGVDEKGTIELHPTAKADAENSENRWLPILKNAFRHEDLWILTFLASPEAPTATGIQKPCLTVVSKGES